jgi:methylglutaconyl-CoA hydratase
MSSLVHTEPLLPGASVLSFQRAERRNALSIDLLDQLCAAIEHLAGQGDQRVVVLRGAGPVFSAGLDLREAMDDTLVDRSAAAVRRALQLVRTTPLITIAAVQGGAYAGGAGLMAACDIAIAADSAQIGFPEARRGLLPALISEPLRNRVREGDLRYLLLTGELITASHALQIGLVQRVVVEEKLMDEARRIAELILAGGPDTIRRTKQLLNNLYATPTGAAHDEMSELHLSARRSDEAREGLAAFTEKRPPWWSSGAK